MYNFILSIHVAACFLLILVVLIQPSKGGGFAIFGGGGENLFSASSGTSFMRNVTIGLSGTFALTSLLLTMMATRVGLGSVMIGDRPPAPAPVAAPAAPAGAPPAGAETGAPKAK